jgi:3-methyladenine DNA glycosylase/8-oxoguanine DNA glycosylase
LRLSESALRAAGMSRNKLLALRDLAARLEDGRLDLARSSRRTDQEVIERLTEVRGIGTWSAQMFLMFRLGRLDVMPAGDLGVREGLRLLDGLDARPSVDEALERAEIWRPLRSVGAWAMWRLVEAHRARALPPRREQPSRADR